MHIFIMHISFVKSLLLPFSLIYLLSKGFVLNFASDLLLLDWPWDLLPLDFSFQIFGQVKVFSKVYLHNKIYIFLFLFLLPS